MCDMKNHGYGGGASLLSELMLVAAETNGCKTGQYTPDGSYLPAEQFRTYWKTQDKMHIVCDAQGTTAPPPPHR